MYVIPYPTCHELSTLLFLYGYSCRLHSSIIITRAHHLSLSLSLSLYFTLCLCLSLSICFLFVSAAICLSVSAPLSICLSVYISVSLPLFVCMCVCLSSSFSLEISFFLSFSLRLFLCLSDSLFLSLSLLALCPWYSSTTRTKICVHLFKIRFEAGEEVKQSNGLYFKVIASEPLWGKVAGSKVILAQDYFPSDFPPSKCTPFNIKIVRLFWLDFGPYNG